LSEVLAGLEHGDVEMSDRVVRQVRADRAAGVGVSEVLTAVCTAFRPKIMSYLRAKWFTDDESAVEDVWAETLERVYNRIEAFDARRSKFRSWVYSQSIWAAQDWLRREKRWRGAGELSEPGDQVAELGSTLEAAEAGAIRRAFAAMSRQEQELLFLRHVLGCRHVEIARHRLAGELPEEHVRVYTNRATKRLERRYQDELAAPTRLESGPSLDEQFPIEDVVRLATANGELDGLACLEADLSAARIGRQLRAVFVSSMVDDALSERFADELQDLPPLGLVTDEEADALLDLA
jgi:RNA polymerase sigma factor (sigma-70 family)